LTELLAEVLGALGTRRALVVHGADGLDEISTTGESKITEMQEGVITTYTIRPEDYGIPRASLKDIQGGDAEENARIILEVLQGKPGPRRDIVLMNAAAALIASSKVDGFQEGIAMATESIATGKAMAKLQRLIEFTNS
jgi:anthranilate phosphoribosyltransferase